MATVVHHDHTSSEGSGLGFVLGVVLLLVFALLFFVYGLPYISNSFRGPQINVPGQIDVNVQNPK
jgi:hypothetical protein